MCTLATGHNMAAAAVAAPASSKWETVAFGQLVVTGGAAAAASAHGVYALQSGTTTDEYRLLICRGSGHDIKRTDILPDAARGTLQTLAAMRLVDTLASTPIRIDAGANTTDVGGTTIPLHDMDASVTEVHVEQLRSVWRLVDHHISRLVLWTDRVNQRINAVNDMIRGILGPARA